MNDLSNKIKDILFFDQGRSLPRNKSASCFMDSVLVALFYDKNPIVHRLLLDFNLNDYPHHSKISIETTQKLRQVCKDFENAPHETLVSQIRDILNECYFKNKLDVNVMQDSQEFLSRFLEVLQVPDWNTCHIQVYGISDLISSYPETKYQTTESMISCGLVWNVPINNHSLIIYEDSGLLSSPLIDDQKQLWYRTWTVRNLNPKEFFIFFIERSIHPFKMDIQETISMKNLQFRLMSCVLHQHSHYTTILINHSLNKYHLYNDLQNNLLNLTREDAFLMASTSAILLMYVVDKVFLNSK